MDPLVRPGAGGGATASEAKEGPPGPRPLHPRQIWAWRCGWGAMAVAGVVVAVAGEVVLAGAGVDVPWPSGAAAAAVALAGAGLAWRLPRLAYDAWRYELTPTTLELQRGVVVRHHSAIPYFRVQHIDITRSPFERALGLSQLVVRTAAATTDARLPGIAASDAERLRDVILARTGRGDAV